MTSMPGGWRVRSLGEIASVIRGVTYKKAEARSSPAVGYIPLVRATNIEAGILLLDAEMVFVPEGRVQHQQRLLPGDVVVAASSGSIDVVGKSALLRREWVGTFGAFCAVVRPTAVLPQYIFLYLQSAELRRRWSAAARGTNINNLKRGDLLDTPVPVPPLDEQRRIVEVLEDHLSRLDAAAALLDTAASRWASLWQSAVEGELTGRTAVGDRGTSPGLNDEGVDDGSLATLSPGWEWMRLGDLADVAGGVTKDAAKQSDPSFTEVPYLRVANVQRGFLDLADVTTIRVPRSTAAKLRLIPGDVLLNEGGDRDKLGRGWVWEGQIDHCIHQNHVFRARVRDDIIDPYLLSWAANSIGGRWCERNGRQSVNLASISLSKIRMMPIPVPPRDEQRAIACRLQALLAGGLQLRAGVRAGVAKTEALRRSLLEAAFSGALTDGSVARDAPQKVDGV